MSEIERAIDILFELAAIKGKTIVIKYGGNAMFDEMLKRSVIRDIVLLRIIGVEPILVHGGGPAITEHLERVQLESEFIHGHRRTDEDTMEVVEMVLSGKVNNELVKLIGIEGGRSIGLSGKDSGLIKARKHLREIEQDGKLVTIDLGNVGEVVEIETELVSDLLDHGYIPVIAPIGVGDDDQDYNINADTLAGELAAALGAEILVYLTDVDGILDQEEQSIRTMKPVTARALLGTVVTGGMIPKVESALSALENGVSTTHIINGTIPHSLLRTFVNDGKGIGTRIEGSNGSKR
jgi:acetylglutamate kinase